MEVELGSKVKDSITDMSGIATARCVYIHGCVQFEITPTQLKDGMPQKEYWLDEPRVILVENAKKKVNAKQKGGNPTWGPRSHPEKKKHTSLAGYNK